jgi:ABC-2 type transport system permease protein
MGVLAGMAMGGLLSTLLRAVVILGIGSLAFTVRFGTPETNWWAVAAVFVLTMIALYGLGMVFASAFLMWGREAWHTVNLLQEPVYLFSGLNYPVRHLGLGVAIVASVIPMTLGIDALRQLLFWDATPLLGVGVEIALLVVLAVVFLGLAWKLLDYLERRAREEGRLTVKWQ